MEFFTLMQFQYESQISYFNNIINKKNNLVEDLITENSKLKKEIAILKNNYTKCINEINYIKLTNYNN